VINEILLKNKKIEIINLSCKLNSFKKGNEINSKGIFDLKESLIKNQNLKEISFDRKFFL
jgi:uncharacterized protein YdgA (DUF945 family)